MGKPALVDKKWLSWFRMFGSNERKQKSMRNMMTYLTEPRPLLSEQRSLGNTPGIHAAKGNSGTVVVSPMQFAHGHHVANLTVLVGLCSEEGLSVSHGDGLLGSLFESREVS
jgi:hypothetical protein